MFRIRSAGPADHDAIWSIIEPTIRASEVFTLPSGMARDEALEYWFSDGHEVFVALSEPDGSERDDSEQDGPGVIGSYYLRANQQGGGDHVANGGYATAPAFTGRGVARTMCAHSLERARERGFRAMQFNFVISTNVRAVRLWQSFGFDIVGRLPRAFRHPQAGFVDAYVMYREL